MIKGEDDFSKFCGHVPVLIAFTALEREPFSVVIAVPKYRPEVNL